MSINEHTPPDVPDAVEAAELPSAAAPEPPEAPTPAEPRIEVIEPGEAFPAGEDEPLEGAEEAGEAAEAEGGEVVDTELSRMLATPAGLRGAIEALLFVSPEPLTPHRIARTLEAGDSRLVLSLLGQLRAEYDEQKRGMQIVETAEGYQMATREVFGDLILRLKNRKRRPTLSPAALETLAIIAYRQPIIRAEVEAVRGVEASGTIRNLIDMGLVEMVGRKEVLGRPPMYGTSEQFLQAFGLRALGDLPPIGELKRRFAEGEAAREAADAAPEPAPPEDLPGQMVIEAPEENPAGAADNTPGDDAGEEEVTAMAKDESWGEDEKEDEEDDELDEEEDELDEEEDLEDDEDEDDEDEDDELAEEEEEDEDEEEDEEEKEDEALADEDDEEDEDDLEFEDEDLEDLEDLDEDEDLDDEAIDDEDLSDLEDKDAEDKGPKVG